MPSTSATTTVPSGPASIPDALWNSPSAEPCLETVPAWVPPMVNTSIWWFLASTMWMRPCGSTATSRMYGSWEPGMRVLNEPSSAPPGPYTCANPEVASATTISPPGPTATSVGPTRLPLLYLPRGVPSRAAMRVPSASNTTTLLLPVSATMMRPRPSTATDSGPASPPAPAVSTWRPAASSTWTRSFPVSATAMRPGHGDPDGATAMPMGRSNEPLPLPRSPAANTGLPSRSNASTLPRSASATSTAPPVALTATSISLLV